MYITTSRRWLNTMRNLILIIYTYNIADKCILYKIKIGRLNQEFININLCSLSLTTITKFPSCVPSVHPWNNLPVLSTLVTNHSSIVNRIFDVYMLDVIIRSRKFL